MHQRQLSSSRKALLEARARQMRLAPTLSELKLWSAIRGQRLGVGFRRQVVIGECIVDFLAPAVRLVVEVDGWYHTRRQRADARRDALLTQLGFRVLRLDSELVMRNLTAALARVLEALDSESRSQSKRCR